VRFISHRGNLKGPSDEENIPQKIIDVISLGTDVEVDVRVYQGDLYTGHDRHQYKINIEFLIKNQKNLWIHCKDFEALTLLSKEDSLNIFWHQNDDYTLTKSGHVWTYPGKKIFENSVAVVLEQHQLENVVSMKPFGICSDEINFLHNLMNNRTRTGE
jgi:hypothetical protein